MKEKVISYIKKHNMISENDHVIAGVSGGADSVCLFLLLFELKEAMGFTLSLVHVEHGIRGEESQRDAEFVKKLGERYGVDCAVLHCLVPEEAKKRGISTEEAARLLRYEILESQAVRKEGQYGCKSSQVKIAVAHHREDLAETMVFHLLRGSGIDGLCGIPPLRGRIIRPLLCISRPEIEQYLIERKQDFCTDSTNDSRQYSRNFIRHEIIPGFCRINSEAVGHMWDLAQELSQVSLYLKEQTNRACMDCIRQEAGSIFCDAKKLWGYAPALQKRILKKMLSDSADSGRDITREHVETLFDLAGGRVGRKASLPYGLEAVKTYGEIEIRKRKKEQFLGGKVFGSLWEQEAREESGAWIDTPQGKICCKIWDFSKKDTEIPKKKYTKWLDYDKIKGGLLFRTRKTGDFFILDEKGHKKYLKDFFIDEKVPRERRDEIILAAEGSHVLWAVGFRISQEYKVTKDTKEILEIRFTEG